MVKLILAEKGVLHVPSFNFHVAPRRHLNLGNGPDSPDSPRAPGPPNPTGRAIRTRPVDVMAKELPMTAKSAPATVDGNFIVGPTHKPAPEVTVHEGVPQGTVYNFTMGIDGQQILSRNRPRAEDPWRPRTGRSRPTDRQQPSLPPTRAALRFMCP